MKMRYQRTPLLFLTVLALAMALLLPGNAPAQRQAGRGMANAATEGQPNPDLLSPLKNALQAAGAPELTTDQETSIKNLIANFRAASRPVPPDGNAQADRLKYDEAILTGDTAAVSAQISKMANHQFSQISARMNAEAAFTMAVAQVLTADQVNLLQKRMGSGGIVGMLQSLAGGPGGPGRGAGRGGMGQGPAVQGAGSGMTKK
jgi:hypothetical protein